MPPETPAARRSRPRSKRPPPGSEAIDIRTGDGWSLRADVHEPKEAPVGTAVLAHAMMARRSEFERPEGAGVVRLLVDRGWRVVNFDFRGHGDSAPRAHEGATYSYDDLVEHDLPAVHEFARSRTGRRKPLLLVGHSLGGHVALAAQGTGEVAFDGVVAVAANVWLPELEPSRVRWLAKRAALSAIVAVCRRVGRFPARMLRLGSDDESRAYFDDFARFARTGAWRSANGDDYLAALDRVRVPVLQIVSDGDRLACVPESGARFVARCGGRHEVVRVARADDGGPPPDHMGLVTGGRIASVWGRAEAWMRRVPVAP
ncbi:MAG TPA: alpha/beta fold hydrolase [Polyangiaceae bacterium]|jgi:predicted alpha/beta hydrolase